jgi:hypothetical protein
MYNHKSTKYVVAVVVVAVDMVEISLLFSGITFIMQFKRNSVLLYGFDLAETSLYKCNTIFCILYTRT